MLPQMTSGIDACKKANDTHQTEKYRSDWRKICDTQTKDIKELRTKIDRSLSYIMARGMSNSDAGFVWMTAVAHGKADWDQCMADAAVTPPSLCPFPADGNTEAENRKYNDCIASNRPASCRRTVACQTSELPY
jgi:hypothetical protein